MKKNDIYSLPCERLGSELEGVCRLDELPVFVPGALPGETCSVRIVKVQPRYAFGKLEAVESASAERTEPFCPIYRYCGGCSGQHMTYEATLKAKRQQVFDCLTRIGHLPITDEQIPHVLGAEQPLHCRNKTAVPVSGTSSDPILGFYRKHSHDSIQMDSCPIAMPSLSSVLRCVREWIRDSHVEPYHEETGKGLLRHVVVRENRAGDVMVLLCVTNTKLLGEKKLIELLQNQVPGFCALHISLNRSKSNVILGSSSEKRFGADGIEETLLGLRFFIPPLSFFQVNPEQTEKLYQKALDFAKLTPEDTVVDAYAGAGTISLCAAKRCKRVIGIEIVPQAVEGAKKNAALNGIENAEFYTAAVEDLLPKMVNDGLRPDAVILDPPRKGAEPSVIEAVVKAHPKRIVYVSCHVPTQARDLQLLAEGGYRFECCQSVDMFCYAGGVENIVSMICAE